MAEAKRLLGPDPLILSVRRRRGEQGQGEWEAIVARESPERLITDNEGRKNEGSQSADGGFDVEGLRSELAEFRRYLGQGESSSPQLLSLAHRLSELEGALVASALKGSAISERWVPLVRRLEQAGYPRVEAVRLVSSLETNFDSDAAVDHQILDGRVRSLLSDGVTVAPARERLEPGLVVFMGGAGVGKTTLAAKLAADLALGGASSPVLGVLKPRQGLSLETIRRCSAALGIEFVEVDSIELVSELADRASENPVILDSPAVNPLDKNSICEFRHLLSAAPEAELHSVVSTCYDDGEFSKAIDAYSWAPKRRISATHLDEAPYVGRVMSAAARSGVPIGYFSLGPRIPDDLSRPVLDSLVDSVLRLEGVRTQ
ncbi:MAG: hypothetical protein KTR25_07510 [Myxococcales bacterium]|nr:hypothetical protein [Myxococcales bacterium]